jgi:glycosyltransferase involved in cell wall biosynthesis
MKLSAWYTIKDEEQYIVPSVMSVAQYVDQVVVIDTGSTDSTVRLIEEKVLPHCNNVELHHFEADYYNLSDAMNHAVSLCTSDYLLRVDGDEVFPDDSIKLIADTVHGFFYNDVEAIDIPILDMITPTECFIREEPVQLRVLRKDLSVYEGSVWQLNVDQKKYYNRIRLNAPFMHYKMLRTDESGMLDRDRYVRRHIAVNMQRYGKSEEDARRDSEESYQCFINERVGKEKFRVDVPEVFIRIS